MTRRGRVVAVGADLAGQVATVLDDADVVGAEDAEAALVELAAAPTDVVVCPAAAVDADVPVAEAAQRRDGVTLLPVVVAESSAVVDGGVTGVEPTVDHGTPLRDALPTMLDPTPPADPDAGLGPLDLTVDDGTIVGADGGRMPPLGHPPHTLPDRELSALVHTEDRESFERLATPSGPDRDLLRMRHYDGDWREVWLEYRGESTAGQRYRVLRRDPDRLPEWFPRGRQAEQLLAALFAHAPIHLFVKDDRGRHVWVNRFHAGDPGETIGKRDVDFDWGAFGERTYTDDLAVIEQGDPILEKEEYWPERDVWSLTSKVPWTDGDGEVQGLVGATRRITERKTYERRLERENERLERFATIVSHDLRTPINVATGHLEMAREGDPGDHLARVERALDRMDRITADVLTMVKKGAWVDDRERVEVAAVARRGWDMVETDGLTLDLAAEVTVAADPDRLQHLFEHAVRHAADHGGGQVTVGDLPEGFFVESDGIPHLEAQHVLETGQVTAAEATGLSLEIVRQVVAAHDWSVAVHERDGEGARLSITGVDPAPSEDDA